MDCKNIGAIISKLRKKNNWTQNELAKKLDVTDKAVSRWESGQGYPDITIFPRLSEVFNVTIDYLMMGERKGIVIAGYHQKHLHVSLQRYAGIHGRYFLRGGRMCTKYRDQSCKNRFYRSRQRRGQKGRRTSTHSRNRRFRLP